MLVRSMMLVLLFASLGTGCTSIPKGELDKHRESFDAARGMSEQVLLEYRQLHELNESLRAAAPSDDAFAWPVFDSSAVSQADADAVTVRMEAWAVIARYNDALLAIAEGRSNAEIGNAVDGLLGALQAFPVEAVAEVGLEAVPYASAIKPVIRIVEQEIAARNFRAAVIAAAPLIERFTLLLAADTDDFWEIHSELSRLQVDRANKRATDLTVRFIALAKPLASIDERSLPPGVDPDSVDQNARNLYQIVEGLDESAARVGANATLVNVIPATPVTAAGGLPAGATPPTDQQLEQLRMLSEQITGEYADAENHREKLIAYRDLLTRYLGLVNGMKVNFARLQSAATSGPSPDTTIDNLTVLVTAARAAYTTYKAQ